MPKLRKSARIKLRALISFKRTGRDTVRRHNPGGSVNSPENEGGLATTLLLELIQLLVDLGLSVGGLFPVTAPILGPISILISRLLVSNDQKRKLEDLARDLDEVLEGYELFVLQSNLESLLLPQLCSIGNDIIRLQSLSAWRKLVQVRSTTMDISRMEKKLDEIKHYIDHERTILQLFIRLGSC